MKKIILFLTSLFIFLFNVQNICAVNNNAGINPGFYSYSQELCSSPAIAIADFWDLGGDMNPQYVIGPSDENYASLGFGEYIVVDLTGNNLPYGSSVTINWRRYPDANSPQVQLFESSSTSIQSWVLFMTTEVSTDNFSNYTISVDENMRYLIIENISNNWLYVESITCTYPCPICIDGILTLTTENNEQTVCQNSAITDIVYSVEGGATGATVDGLPDGLTGNFSDGIFTISGAPNESNIFSFTVRTTGTTSPCTEAIATGSIIVIVNPSGPTGYPIQAFSPYTNPTIANLTVLGTNIQWYTSEIGGIALNPETALVDGMHYYASQTVDGCESIERFNVGVIIYASSTLAFNTTGTFVVPNGVTEINVKAWGGGGGGSGRSSSDDPERYAGGGGGGGGFASGTFPVYEGATVTVNVGRGGKGGSGSGEDGQQGGTTQVIYFMGQLLALGGEGGYAGITGPGEGGSGRTASIAGYVPNFSSHLSGNGSDGDSDNGGGGGGGAGDTSAGGNGTITSGGDGGTNYGGKGGNGSTGDESGGAGLSYGGGGGGASDNDNSSGGDGGKGVAIIIWDAGGCSNPTSGGEISGSQTICSGNDPDAFVSVSPASGETGTLEYKWQYSDVNDPYDWEDFASSNTATYDDNENLEGTRWYRRLARVECSADWTGAASSNIFEVTIKEVDEAGIEYNGPTTFCEGGSVTLTALAVGSFLWSTEETTKEITVTTSGEYYVTVTNENGCSVTTPSVSVTVNPMPTLSGVSVDNVSSCFDPDADPVITFSGLLPGENNIFYALNEEHIDEPLELVADANGDATYSFDLGVGTFNLSIDQIRTPGCEINPTENNTVTWTVYAIPTANAGSGGDACDLDFVLDATPSVGIGIWTLESGPGTAGFSDNANTPNATVTVEEYGTYVFRWTEENGPCSDYDEVIVNFYEQPVAYAGEDQSQCDNSTFTIGPATKAADIGPSGIWSFDGDNGGAVVTDKYSETTTVTNVPFGHEIILRWTVTNGTCIDFDDVVLHNNSLPNANIYVNGSTTICQGGSVELSASEGSGYLWSTEETSQTIYVTTSGSYSVTVTNAENCSATSEPVTVTVLIPPDAPNAVAQSFCSDDSPIVADLKPAYIGDIIYTWFDVSEGGEPLDVTDPISTGKYYVSQTVNGCESARTLVYVIVNTSPEAPTASPQSFCIGDNPLVAGLKAFGEEGAIFNWYYSEEGGTPIFGKVQVASGTYYVSQTVNGCESPRTEVNVTVNDMPEAGELEGKQLICEGTYVTWSVFEGETDGIWSSDNTSVATVSEKGQVSGITSGTANISYTVEGKGGCEGAYDVATMTINVVKPPNAGNITGPETLCIREISQLSSDGDQNGSWTSLDDDVLSVDKNGSVIAVGAGTAAISYFVEGAGGCKGDETIWKITIFTNSIAPTLASSNPATSEIADHVCSGNLVNLTVSGGELGTNPDAAWTWYKGSCSSGELIGTGESIEVQPTESTTYFVRAEGGCNTTACASVDVWVWPETEITEQPSDALISYGCLAMLEVSATGQNLSYQWYQNSVRTNEGGSPIIDATTTEFWPDCSEAGEFYYYVVVTGTCGSVNSDVVNLTVDQQAASASGILYYTGPKFAFTQNENSGTATIMLSATIKNNLAQVCSELGSLAEEGDIRTALLSFEIDKGNGWEKIPGATNLPMNYVDPNNISLGGTAAALAQIDIGNESGMTCELRVVVSGNYTEKPEKMECPITIVRPQAGGIITGTVGLCNDNSAGFVKGMTGDDYQTVLNFEVKYSETTKTHGADQPKGKVWLLISSLNNPQGIPDGAEHTYLISSNAIADLAIKCPTGHFTAKANVVELLDNGMINSIEGNCTMVLDLEKGETCDKVGITVYKAKSKGGIWYSNNWTSAGKTIPECICSDDFEIGGCNVTEETVSVKTKSIVIEPEIEQPELKVYPNPFSEWLRFEFVSPEDGNARIDVYDMTGRLVKTVFDGRVEKDVTYRPEFNSEFTISEIFIYRMIFGETVITGKAIYKK